MRSQGMFITCMVACLAVAGCASLQDIVAKPSVEVADVRLTNLSLSAATLLVDLNIDNPNPVGIDVRTVDYNLKINNKNLLQGTANQGIKLPGSGSEQVELPLQVNYFLLWFPINTCTETILVRKAHHVRMFAG